MSMEFRNFISKFDCVKETPLGSGQYLCRCPAHKDRKASLSIKDLTADSDKILLHCQAGCQTDSILASVGLSMKDIQPGKAKPERPQPWQRDLVAEYRYCDADGKYLFSKLRYERKGKQGKEIRYGKIVEGKYTPGKGGASAVLYRLPELLRAIKAGKKVYIVEGEKDCETLRDHGFTATTAGGVGDWKQSYADCFRGASEVVILADRDDPGRDLAKRISHDLRKVVFQHRIVVPSGSNHGDVSDYLTDEGGTVEDLLSMISSSELIPARWVTKSRGGTSVNPDLLAAEILQRNHIFIARNPGTNSDIVHWYKCGVYRPVSDAEIGTIVRSWLPVGRANPDTIGKVVRMLKYSAPIRDFDEINGYEDFINLKNGLLRVEDWEILPHDPELTTTVQLNCEFRAGVTAPRWIQFIESLCMDPEAERADQQMVDVIQEVCGFLLSQIWGFRVKKAIIFFAPIGNTGRSVLFSVLATILGKDSIANICFQDLGASRWATGRAFGKRCLLVGDEGGSEVQSSQVFKQMTGGDIVSAELKGLQGFDYQFRGVIVAACNNMPYFSDDKGNHLAERLLLLHCRNPIPEESRDLHLLDDLKQELDGIFMWCMIGLRRFLENGMRFSRCDSSDALMQEYRARHDSCFAYLSDRMQITGKRSDSVRKTELEDDYTQFCDQNERRPLTKDNLKARLASLGITLAIRDGYRCYTGVKFKDFVPPNPEDPEEF